MTLSLKIQFTKDELDALQQAAIIDLRKTHSQARYLIRQELERRGFLNDDKSSSSHPGAQFEEKTPYFNLE